MRSARGATSAPAEPEAAAAGRRRLLLPCLAASGAGDGSTASGSEPVDASAAAAHLTLDPDGDLIISGADTKIDATKKLYLDGGGDSYIHESSADVLQVYTGGDKVVEITEATTGNKIDFGTTGEGLLNLSLLGMLVILMLPLMIMGIKHF